VIEAMATCELLQSFAMPCLAAAALVLAHLA